MLATLRPAATPAQGSAVRRIERILRTARHARAANPRTAGLYATAPTITDNAATQPSQTPNAYPVTATSAGVWHITGGSLAASANNVIVGSTYYAGSAQPCMSRWEAMINARYLALQIRGTGKGYRLIVDSQFVSVSNSLPQSVAKGWALIDFGTRAIRRIIVDVSLDGSIFAGAVEATGKMWAADLADTVHATMVGDSYEGGTGPTLAADAPAMQMGDWLGCAMHSSGVGGTGWINPGASRYLFGQRLGSPANDIPLSPYAPDIVFLKASVNDRTYTASAITSAILAGLQSVRANYPTVPIIVFGSAGASYVSSVLANEAAAQAAVSQFANPLCAFAPLSTDPNGAWITGTGKVGTTASDGNSDWATVADGTHPSDEGAAYLGRLYAAAAIGALKAIYQP